jgi:hypothetical protein
MWYVLGNILHLEVRLLLGEKLSVMEKCLVKLESVASFTV